MQGCDRLAKRLETERLNPEVTVEIEKEAPKQAYGIALPLELGGKRGKRMAVSEAQATAILTHTRNERFRTLTSL